VSDFGVWVFAVVFGWFVYCECVGFEADEFSVIYNSVAVNFIYFLMLILFVLF